MRPDFIIDKAWNRYCNYWASADFKATSEKASHNRKNEKDGPSTGPSKHTDGTQSFWTYEDILALDKDEDDEVTPNDVFLHVHMNYHNRVQFIDSRSAQFHVSEAREEHTQATPNQPIDEEQLYYDAVGVYPKGRIYGLGSLARKIRRYANPGASIFNWECAWTLVRTPLRHHHRQHLMGIISRLGWIQLVHHSNSKTMTIEKTRIGWTRSTLVTKVSTPKESFEGGAGHWRRPTAGFLA
ncbi:hypothetical protein Syun_006962 [Stephania yunnanensis]|uniref:Uncharacterized protein n=1 Tax=Stephania yunnanensis TaxID=152371 RepID=A0AAP0KXW3_9MAGN